MMHRTNITTFSLRSLLFRLAGYATYEHNVPPHEGDPVTVFIHGTLFSAKQGDTPVDVTINIGQKCKGPYIEENQHKKPYIPRSR